MDSAATGLTYPEAGATRGIGDRPPPGYRYFRVRTRIGAGQSAQRAAGQALLDWRMHRALGVTMDATAPVAAPGVRVVVGLGVGRWRLRAPCEVVWTAEGDRETGFGYGTLPGHPERGEESFLVERGADDVVTLTVTAFSRPATWYLRALGPVGRGFQRAYARRCGVVLRGLVAAAQGPGQPSGSD